MACTTVTDTDPQSGAASPFGETLGGLPSNDGMSASDAALSVDTVVADAGSAVAKADSLSADTECYPECFAKECGDDGCGGECGTCPEGFNCSKGVCEEVACVATCAGMECGDDGCGGSCGTCGPNASCMNGQCFCDPSCEAKECGGDGCGGSCGSCPQGEACMDGQCECAPDCAGKTCGDDGCGGSCGDCGCTQQKVFIRALSQDGAGKLQVFFKTLESPSYNELDSETEAFPTSGKYVTVAVAVGKNTGWSGTITGIRIDPLMSNSEFGIDDVCVGETPDDCLLHWSFDGADEVTNPFFGWKIKGVANKWTDGEKWGRGRCG